MKKNIFYFIILLFVTFSCIPAKKVKYLQAEQQTEIITKYTAENTEYQLQLGDNLYINISSLDPETGQIISPNARNIAAQGASAKYKDIYLIDNEGFINVPQIGSIKVENYTLNQVQDALNQKFEAYFTQVNLQVRLADGFITILGEVNKPGRYQIDYKDKISVYELLGLAGDLTTYANRNEIKIVRRKNNENLVFKLDLTKETILESENYYLQANDIVYVEPLKAVFFGTRSFPFMTTVSVILATATSLLVIFTYLKP